MYLRAAAFASASALVVVPNSIFAASIFAVSSARPRFAASTHRRSSLASSVALVSAACRSEIAWSSVASFSRCSAMIWTPENWVASCRAASVACWSVVLISSSPLSWPGRGSCRPRRLRVDPLRARDSSGRAGGGLSRRVAVVLSTRESVLPAAAAVAVARKDSGRTSWHTLMAWPLRAALDGCRLRRGLRCSRARLRPLLTRPEVSPRRVQAARRVIGYPLHSAKAHHLASHGTCFHELIAHVLCEVAMNRLAVRVLE